MEKTKKNTKTKSSDPCPLPGLSPDVAHGSDFLFFFVSFGFLEVLAKLQETMEKTKTKKTKSSDPCPLPGLSPDPMSMGLIFFCFSMVFWHVFPY